MCVSGMMFCAGCYEHVVEARGFGAQSITTHDATEPIIPEGPSESEARAQRRRELRELGKSAPKAPKPY
jgi:hypothetical protein